MPFAREQRHLMPVEHGLNGGEIAEGDDTVVVEVVTSARSGPSEAWLKGIIFDEVYDAVIVAIAGHDLEPEPAGQRENAAA